MTYTKTTTSFVNFFEHFLKYWDCTSKRGIEYSELEVVIRTAVISSHLHIEWKARKWDLEEFRWICSALDSNYDILNPNYFINDKVAYINHLKNCYYLDNNESIYPIRSF